MESDFVFRVLVGILLFSFVIHRGIQTRRRSPQPEQVDRVLKTDSGQGVINLLSISALISSVVYIVFPDWLKWAALPLANWLRWIGLPIALTGFAILEWAQSALAKNWSDQPIKLKDQTLTKTEPYAFVRHPIYTGFLLILSAPLFLSANWLVGFTWIAATYLDLSNRIKMEEAMLSESFGDEFRDHVKKTGRLFPRFQ